MISGMGIPNNGWEISATTSSTTIEGGVGYVDMTMYGGSASEREDTRNTHIERKKIFKNKNPNCPIEEFELQEHRRVYFLDNETTRSRTIKVTFKNSIAAAEKVRIKKLFEDRGFGIIFGNNGPTKELPAKSNAEAKSALSNLHDIYPFDENTRKEIVEFFAPTLTSAQKDELQKSLFIEFSKEDFLVPATLVVGAKDPQSLLSKLPASVFNIIFRYYLNSTLKIDFLLSTNQPANQIVDDQNKFISPILATINYIKGIKTPTLNFLKEITSEKNLNITTKTILDDFTKLMKSSKERKVKKAKMSELTDALIKHELTTGNNNFCKSSVVTSLLKFSLVKPETIEVNPANVSEYRIK